MLYTCKVASYFMEKPVQSEIFLFSSACFIQYKYHQYPQCPIHSYGFGKALEQSELSKDIEPAS